MKKVIVVLVVLLLAMASAQAAFVPPTAAQIKAAADDPAQIKALLKDATPDQASGVLLSVIRRLQQMDIKPEVKKERVGKLFAAVQEVMGKNAGLVISDAAKRINPELLPTVAAPGAGAAQPSMPIALPLAPPIQPGAPAPAPALPPPPPPPPPPYTGQ